MNRQGARDAKVAEEVSRRGAGEESLGRGSIREILAWEMKPQFDGIKAT